MVGWHLQDARRRKRILALACGAALVAFAVAGCGSAPPNPRTTLRAFISAWGAGHWTAMRAKTIDPPKDFVSVNSSVFTALGVTHATVTSHRLIIARSGNTATAKITTSYRLPATGVWSGASTGLLIKRRDVWHVRWAPSTIDPKLRSGYAIGVNRVWPARAPILGAGGAALTKTDQQVSVGVVGSRIKHPATVSADLIAAGAPAKQVKSALVAAKADPTYFEPVFTISQARFLTLKAQSGPGNVYNVPGTQFEATHQSAAITRQLGAHIIGALGPITAEQLKQLGAPYDEGSLVGQSGLEASQQKALAGTPTAEIEIENSVDTPITRLATFPGKPGTPVRTSIDPTIQRAAEAALATSTRPDVSMIAIRASTGQVVAAVSDPISTYNTAMQGAYPPGSTFKVLTSSALFTNGLTPASPATCPATVTVDGETFHNAEGDLPVSTITQAFTESCNTAFIGLATKNLSAADYPAVAALYGLQRTPEFGLPAFMDNIPKPSGPTGLAADAIGQGNITFSALGMATVAAAVDSGVARAPRLVTGAADDSIPGSNLPSTIVNELRPMMAAVVSSGTAAGTGLPAGTYAKTGTAEYGTGPQSSLKIDGWLMGYRGDIAFAIVTHNTGGPNGGPINGPIIAKFLNAIG